MTCYEFSDGLAHFSRRGVERFDGMLNKSAAVVAAAATVVIGEDLSWDGRAFLEIGVYKGKFFSLVEYATRGTDCRMIGVDPFNLEGQSREGVLARLDEGGAELERVHLIKGLSSDVDTLRTAIGGRTLTLCHIDGSHKEPDVYADLLVVDSLLGEDGIVIADDFLSKSQLGVTTAIFRLVLESKADLRPFMISNTKLYLCREAHLERYKKAFIAAFTQNPGFTLFNEWLEKRASAPRWLTEQNFSRWSVLII